LDALAPPVDEPQSHSTHCKIPILCNAWRPGTVNVTTLAITAARAIAVSMTEVRSMAGKIHAHGLGPVNDDRELYRPLAGRRGCGPGGIWGEEFPARAAVSSWTDDLPDSNGCAGICSAMRLGW
jgi:hypothetical protein